MQSDVTKPEAASRSTPPAGSASSLDIHEAIERLLTLAGISCEPGWELTDMSIVMKLDMARDAFTELYNR